MTEARDSHEVDIHNKAIYEHDKVSFIISGPDAHNELTGIVSYNHKTCDFWVITTLGNFRLDDDLLHVELIRKFGVAETLTKEERIIPSKEKQKLPYGTKEEAQRRFNEKTIDIETRLCPLRDKHCRRSCICCRKLEIVNIGSLDNPIWECHGGFCTAYALVGPQ